MTLRDQIIEQALALPVEDRAYVADLLEESLQDASLNDQEMTEAWSREIERRVQAYDRGETTAIDADDAIVRMRQALDQHRARRAGL